MSTIFFDVDTQLDFLYPAGALYVPAAELVVENFGQLNRWAFTHSIPVISTVDAHTENDPEFAFWPPHCIAGTWGQQKAAVTLLEKRVTIPNSAGRFQITGAQQIVVEKQSTNCFTAVQLATLLDELKADRCVVYGVVTEICVRQAALGLLKSGRKVELVADAVQALNNDARDQFVAEFAAAGGIVTSIASLIA